MVQGDKNTKLRFRKQIEELVLPLRMREENESTKGCRKRERKVQNLMPRLNNQADRHTGRGD